MVNDLTEKLSLNEMLRIFIPGIYFCYNDGYYNYATFAFEIFVSMQESLYTVLLLYLV